MHRRPVISRGVFIPRCLHRCPQAQVSGGAVFPCTGRRDGVHCSRSALAKMSFDCASPFQGQALRSHRPCRPAIPDPAFRVLRDEPWPVLPRDGTGAGTRGRRAREPGRRHVGPPWSGETGCETALSQCPSGGRMVISSLSRKDARISH